MFDWLCARVKYVHPSIHTWCITELQVKLELLKQQAPVIDQMLEGADKLQQLNCPELADECRHMASELKQRW